MKTRIIAIGMLLTIAWCFYGCRKRNAEYYVNKAMKQIKSCENFCPEALASLDKAIELNPNYAEAHYYRASYVFDGCEPDDENTEIMTHYSKAIEINPSYIDAYAERAFCWRLMRKYSEAIRDYTTLMTLKPDDLELYYERGEAWSMIGEHEKAIADFTTIIERNSSSADSAYAARGDEWIQQANYPSAIADYTRAIEISEPYNDLYYYSRGMVWKYQGDDERAISDFTMALEKTGSQEKDIYFERGLLWNRQGEYEHAIHDFTEVIDNLPFHRDTELTIKCYRHRGMAWHQQGAREKALNDFKHANILEAEDLIRLGEALSWQGKDDQALQTLTTALSIAPDRAEGYALRGRIWQKKKAYAQAIRDFTTAIELVPYVFEPCQNNSFPTSELAWILATCSEDAYRNGGKALELAQHLISQRDDVESRQILAAAYAENSNFLQAIESQQRVVAFWEKHQKSPEDTVRLTQAKNQLEAYQAHRAWRE